MPKSAAVQTLDMTNVKDGSAFNKKRQPEGDYKAKITSVESVNKKDDKSKKMWLFSIKVNSGVYPFYCGFGENELWKIRNLWAACGKTIPKKRVKLDPNSIVGRDIGVTLQDTEYDGKMQSEIGATFPTSELAENDEDIDDEDVDDEDEDDEEDEDEDESSDDDEDEEDEDDDEDDEDEDEDDDEEEEEEEPEPPKKLKKKASSKKAKPAAKKTSKKKRKASEVTDDELEELDVEDI